MGFSRQQLESALPYAQPFTVCILLAGVALFSCSGCATYKNEVNNGEGKSISTKVSSFGAKVDFQGLQTSKTLGPEGYSQTIEAESAGAESQFKDLAAVFLAGSQIAASSGQGSGESIDPELFRALLDKIPGPSIDQDEEEEPEAPVVSDQPDPGGGVGDNE